MSQDLSGLGASPSSNRAMACAPAGLRSPDRSSESTGFRESGSPGSPNSRNASPATVRRCSGNSSTTRTPCSGRLREPLRHSSGLSGAPRTFGRAGCCIAATLSWPATWHRRSRRPKMPPAGSARVSGQGFHDGGLAAGRYLPAAPDRGAIMVRQTIPAVAHGSWSNDVPLPAGPVRNRAPAETAVI
jgi:hypothetical protein